MKHISTYIISLLAASFAAGCAWVPGAPEPAAPARVVRLDSAALAGDSVRFLAAGAPAAIWLNVVGADSSRVSDYFASLQGKPYNQFVAEQFASTDSLAAVTGSIFNNVAKLTGATPPAMLVTVVSPYNQSVVTADSVVFVALNHYLGPHHDFYAYFPYYQRRLKDSSRIGIDVAEAVVAERFPYDPQSKYPTALSRMAAEGAVVEAVMQLTDAPEQEALGYSDEEYSWLEQNEQPAWESLLARNLVFSTDPSVTETLVRPNSVTSFLHPEAPGRAGRYIGHRIVRSYLSAHPSESLSAILSPAFYNDPKLLEKAGYVGK